MQNWLKTALIWAAMAIPGAHLAAESTPPPTPPPTPASTTTASHAHGVHGMVLFGEPGRVFASHLPLYRHPHDWQVVLELQPVSDAGQKLTNALLEQGGLLTLEPERFDLWRLKPGASDPLTRFSAMLYRDHFERGGEQVQAFDWLVKRTWIFEPVHVKPHAAGHRYLPVGADRANQTGWLLHQVERRPDTDQIIRIHTVHALTDAVQVEDLLSASSTDTRFQIKQLLWQDRDDLQ